MSTKSLIEWTDATWNPVTGCTKVSQGCKHCYAEVMSKRLSAMQLAKYRNGFKITLQPDDLELPLSWKKPRRIFVNSMSDLFHDDVPESYIHQVFDVMKRCPQHTFQVLTKRSERLAELGQSIDWPDNVWMGVSVELAMLYGRIDRLRICGAKVKFLSLEPLLGPLPHINLCGIHWVIVGGESGPGARPIEADWVRDIRDQCIAAKVPFFFKQWGGVRKSLAGREIDGRSWDEMP